MMKKMFFLGMIAMLSMAWMVTSVPAADTIAIGCVTPLSGGYAQYGINTKRGLELAFEEINAAGGVKIKDKSYQLKVEACDDEGKSDVAATCGRKIASMYRAPIIYTPTSYAGFPMMGYNEKMNFIVMATSQSPPFTQKGNKLVMRWLNSVDRSMGPWVKFLLSQFKKNNLNIQKIGVMEINTEIGKNWAGAFMREWKANGGEISAREIFDANATDFYTQMTSLLAGKPDAIMMCGPPAEPSSLIFKQGRELGFKGIFICSVSTDAEKLVTLVKPEWLENTFVESLSWTLPNPEVDALKVKYQKKFNEAPVWAFGLSYEGGYAIKRAIEKAQSFEPSKLWEVFNSILPLPNCMFCGKDMDKTGDIYFPTFLQHFKGGKLNALKD
jgi:branched-chain amino acid transport system substrate-binding protein